MVERKLKIEQKWRNDNWKGMRITYEQRDREGEREKDRELGGRKGMVYEMERRHKKDRKRKGRKGKHKTEEGGRV